MLSLVLDLHGDCARPFPPCHPAVSTVFAPNDQLAACSLLKETSPSIWRCRIESYLHEMFYELQAENHDPVTARCWRTSSGYSPGLEVVKIARQSLLPRRSTLLSRYPTTLYRSISLIVISRLSFPNLFFLPALLHFLQLSVCFLTISQ